MSADFWAGYLSGAVGILIGNPLDVLKVRLQSGQPLSFPPPPPSPSLNSPAPSHQPHSSPPTTTTLPRSFASHFDSFSSLLRGAAAPILGYGALNALLFVAYNRSVSLLSAAGGACSSSKSSAGNIPSASATPPGIAASIAPASSPSSPPLPSLLTIYLAGAIGGLATWVISTPTELIKCRAQMATFTSTGGTTTPRFPSSSSSTSSLAVAHALLRASGPRGLYAGGAITALRDAVGYGFYFWTYELGTRLLAAPPGPGPDGGGGGGGVIRAGEAARVLLCGGVAGVATWASIFPLDVVKTRLQTQDMLCATPPPPQTPPGPGAERTPLPRGAENVHADQPQQQQQQQRPQLRRRLGAIAIAREAYRSGGAGVFFRGIGVCSVRAFVVNAVQWAVYEWAMRRWALGGGAKESVGSASGRAEDGAL